MANLNKQTTQLPAGYNLDVEGRRSTWDKIYLGLLRDNNDTMGMSRLKVYIPELCVSDTPDNWIIVDYASPFSGGGGAATGGERSYGANFVPQSKDDQIICAFINGDPNRGIWMACLVPVGSQRMIPSNPGTNGVINNTDSKLNGAKVPDPVQTTLGNDAGNIKLATQYNGPATRSAGNSTQVNGISTPGGHGIVMDDDASDGYVRLQTRYGATVMLHDSSDTVIISTGSGLSRIEMDRNGDIKIFGHNDVSIAADGFLNLTGKLGVNIQSGEVSDSGNTEGPINIYSTGEAHFYSEANMHVKSNKNMLITSQGEMHRFANGNIYDTAAGEGSIQITSGKDILTSALGDIETWANKNIHSYAASGSIDLLAMSSIRVQSQSADISIKSAADMRLQTLGSFDLTVAENTNITSILSTSVNTGGSLRMQSGSHLDVVSGDYLRAKSTGDLSLVGGGNTLINGNGNLELKAGSGQVLIGPKSTINASVFTTIPDPILASATSVDLPISGPKVNGDLYNISVAYPPYSADSIADRPDLPHSAMTAETPKLLAHTVLSISGAAGENRVVTQVYGVTSAGGTPGADPDQTRVVCPGYSNTLSVMRKETLPESGFKLGQYKDGQTIPLQVMGFVQGGTNLVFSKYTGASWNNNLPQYLNRAALSDPQNPRPEPYPMDQKEYFTVGTNTWPVGKPDAAGVKLMTSDDGVGNIQNHEGNPPPPNRRDMPFPSVCDTSLMMVGYGHVISTPVELEIYSGGISGEAKLALLRKDLSLLEPKVMNEILNAQLTQKQWDALMDFVFLVGFDNFKKYLAPFLNQKSYDAVPTEMVKWIIACGVERPEIQLRQQENAALFSGQPFGSYFNIGKTSASATSTKAQAIYCYLTGTLGYNPAIACGFIGNMCSECGLNEQDGFPNSSPVGLIQWLGARRTNLINFAASKGANPASATLQMQFIQQELNTSYSSTVLAPLNRISPSDVISATNIINQYYEVSESGQAERGISPYAGNQRWLNEAAGRRANAQSAYNKFANDPNVCSNLTITLT